jgi:spore coat polysaccharide biosynthesis protein SpsF
MKVVAIIQARMGSTRLPGKILMPISGKPLLWHIVQRLASVSKIDKVIIATSDSSFDDPVIAMAADNGISIYRGSEMDVLERFHDAAELYKADHVIRVTGDCPLVDPQIIEKLIGLYFGSDYDLCGVACGAGMVYQTEVKRFPDGLDAEIFSMKTLSEAHQNAKSKLHREHVTPYIWKNEEQYSVGALHPEKEDYSQHRWTVDNEEDFKLIRWIYEVLYSRDKLFTFNDILKLLSTNPLKNKLNKHLIGEEGYEQFWE